MLHERGTSIKRKQKMINPVPENVEKILNSPAHLKVPKYQRDYKWGTSEAGEFWEDLESYLSTNNDHLFLGNLIFDISKIGNKEIGIIDGQQRITTILILLIACRQLAKKINALKIASKIQEKICFEDSTTGEFLGSRLTASDLLKNYLFSNLGNSAEETWYRITELSGGTILKMLKYFYVSKNGKVSKSDLYKKLKQYGKDITPQTLLSELEVFANFYNAIRTADIANMMNYFEQIELNCLLEDQEKFEDVYFSIEALRLFKITQMYPLILSAIGCYLRSGYGANKSFNPKIVKFFKQLENYHFINNAICERIGNEVESLYADYSKKFAESSNFDETSAQLYKELKNQIAMQDEFSSRFTDISYQPSSIPMISYIFDKINNYGLSAGQRVRIFNPDERILRRNHNIEHFYPQNPLPTSKLPRLGEDEINNIGNLLCISFRTNSKLGNLDPKDKAEKLSKELESEIVNTPYVRKFLTEYHDRMHSWDKSIINKRAESISKDAYTRVWNFN